MSPVSGKYIAARDNPFASHRVEAVPFCFAEGDWTSNLSRLQAMNWRGAIVGNQGSGKTTLMLEMKARLEQHFSGKLTANYCFLSRDSRDHPKEIKRLGHAASRGQILLVDGIERLGRLRRWRLLQGNSGQTRLVVTAHGPTRLPVWIHCQTNWSLMKTVLQSLVESPDEWLVRETSRLFEMHRGNIREVLRSLYDLQNQPVFWSG